MTRTTVYLWLGYACIMTTVVFALYHARSAAVEILDTSQARAKWDAWRAETVELSKTDGPMKRREAKAREPPGLILARDYFPALATAIIMSATLFYWFFVFLIRGSLQTPSVRGLPEPGAAA